MNLTKLRDKLHTRDTVRVRNDRVRQFGCVKLVERVLTPVARPFKDEDAAKGWLDYSNSELWLYHTGNCRIEQWSQLATIWKTLYASSKSKAVNSAYGHVFKADQSGGSQWTRAKELLLADKHTRRAFVQFLLPEFSTDKVDVPCSVIASFNASQRDLSLLPAQDFGIDVVYFMRSTDILYGLPHDIIWAKSLSMRMQMELAKAKGLAKCHLSRTSTVTFVTANLHEYYSHQVPVDQPSRHFKLDYVEGILDFIVFGSNNEARG